jgi:hypothetical protein
MNDEIVHIAIVNEELRLVARDGSMTFEMQLSPRDVFRLAKSLAAHAAKTDFRDRQTSGVDLAAPSYSMERLPDGLHLVFDRHSTTPMQFTFSVRQAIDFAKQLVGVLDIPPELDQAQATIAPQKKSPRPRSARSRRLRRLAANKQESTVGRRRKRQSRRRTRGSP